MNAVSIDTPERFYGFLRETGTKVLSNIIFPESPGHQILELDNFLRMYQTGRVARDRKYLWVQQDSPMTRALSEIYGAAFRQFNLHMSVHDSGFQMMSDICQLFPELGIDVGLSHLKNSAVSREGAFPFRFGGRMYYGIRNASVMSDHYDYFKLRGMTANFNPWDAVRPTINGPLADLVGGDLDRLAVVHFRINSGNGGVAFPAQDMLPALAYLRDTGFTVVKLGTEPCPTEFSRFGVVNYSESPLRCFHNDLALLYHAKIAMINASGLENIVDLMDIPFVSYARWHLHLTPYSHNAIVLPTLLFDPIRQRLLTFGEQMLVIKTDIEYSERKSWQLSRDRFVPRNPQPDELLAAVQEAVGLGARRETSALQLRFKQIDPTGPLSVVESAVSEFFLQRFQSLL